MILHPLFSRRRLGDRRLAGPTASAMVGLMGLMGLISLADQAGQAVPIQGTAPSAASAKGGGPQRPGAVPAGSTAGDGARVAEDAGPHRPTGIGHGAGSWAQPATH